MIKEVEEGKFIESAEFSGNMYGKQLFYYNFATCIQILSRHFY
jgi:guanylate kinase